jgi:acetyl esterase
MSTDQFDAAAADELHPEISGLLEFLDAGPIPSFEHMSPEGARSYMKTMFPEPEEPEPVGDILEFSIGDAGIPVRVYVPEGEGPFPTLVYFHGGGWVLGDLDSFDDVPRALVNETGCMVVSVDYRLAPEHKFPTPVEDCYTAVEWVCNDAESMQVDTDNVGIVGDSSGGNLAAAVALLARDRDGPSIAHQTLIYPVTDRAFDTDSYEENAEGYFLTRQLMKWFWDQYLETDVDEKNPYAAPLQARDLEGLPPATVITCGYDPLRDEGADYANRLQEDGVPVTFINYEDCIHGIVEFLDEPMELTRANEVIDDIADEINTAFD